MIAWLEENKTLERYVELSAIRQSQPTLAPNNFFVCVCAPSSDENKSERQCSKFSEGKP